MRDLYGDDDSPAAEQQGLAGLIPEQVRRVASAAVFLGLILIMGLWAYRLGTRDAGDVPIIRAMEGPARVRPEDPGGEQAPHQGLEVNSVLAGDPAPPPTDAVPAEPAPQALAAEDLPQEELPVAAVTEALPMSVSDAGIAVTEGPFSTAEPLVPTNGSASLQDGAVTLDPVLVEDEAGLAEAGIAETGLAEAGADEAGAVEAGLAEAGAVEAGAGSEAATDEDAGAGPEAQAQLAGIAGGPRPKERPVGFSRAPAPAVEIARASPAAVPAAATTAPASAPSVAATPQEVTSLGRGTRLVQLGAFDSEAITREAWARLVRQHPDLLGGKSLYLERATNNARVFYRLRVAGFDDTEQTRRMCEALRARGVDCIPVTLQ